MGSTWPCRGRARSIARHHPDGLPASECTPSTTRFSGLVTKRHDVAYIRRGIGNNSLDIVSRSGQVFGEPREIHSTGAVTAVPFWRPTAERSWSSRRRRRANRGISSWSLRADSSEPAAC